MPLLGPRVGEVDVYLVDARFIKTLWQCLARIVLYEHDIFNPALLQTMYQAIDALALDFDCYDQAIGMFLGQMIQEVPAVKELVQGL